MIRNNFIALILISLWLAPVQASDLISSWRAARSHDANYAAAKNALVAGLEFAEQGDAALLPQVSLSGNADSLRKDYRPGQGASDTSTKLTQGQQVGLNLTLVQPIYDAAAWAKRDDFHKQSQQAELQFRVAEQDLVLRVAKAYFDVLLAGENLSLVAAQKEAIAVQLAMAKKRFQIGAATITDTHDAQARYDAILASEITAVNDLEIKSSSYRRLTSLDPAILEPVPESFQAPEPAPDTVSAWLAQAAEGSLAVKAQQLGLDIASLSIDRYRLETAPTLSLVAAYGSQIDSRGISSSGGRDQTLSSSIGVQLSIPLYTGGSRSSQLRQALAVRDQQRDTLVAARRDAEEFTRQAFLGVKGGVAQIRALEQARRSSASSLASSKRGRDLGVRTTVDVLNAEQNYYQTVYSLVAARYQYLLSRLQLAASVGQLGEAELAQLNGYLARGEVSGRQAEDNSVIPHS